jgi:hypothetical protein
VKVKSDYVKDTDFSQFKSYRWISGIEINRNDDLSKRPSILKRVQNSVNKTLDGKGFNMMESEDSDFIVTVHARLSSQTRVDWVAGPSAWYDPWGGPYSGSVRVGYIDEGTLIIDVIDPAEKKIVWRGSGKSVLKNYSDSKADKMQKELDEMVEKIMKTFPPNS